ncbi:Rad52/Rad22 family DNA repair protein (plasmid) [Clostridium beijerinckii]|uniref:Rad52/Rad22 family DNA repair protein n=1 Tax=Clostridium beijerinckii TaxID=1520 RepID=UPI0022278ED7|nr:Rad52/Rad22 family DNA repair protein [Clostridium beijerinckii]UYZ38969.1 Rad52/Rad22 family DNA repair protein [Clostridium beijerinckii]
MVNNENSIMERLQAPFSIDEICFKVNNTNKEKSYGLVVPYVKNKAIQDRLDEVFTPFGWKNSFRDWKNGNAQICTISVYDAEKQIWISKEDGAENTLFSSVKGGLSDSMKRCARMFGIGRYLLSLELSNNWIRLTEKGDIPDTDLARFKKQYNQFLSGKKAASMPDNNSTSKTHQISSNNVTSSAGNINNSKNNKTITDANAKSSRNAYNVNNSKQPSVGTSNKGEVVSNKKDTTTSKTPLPAPLVNAISQLLKQNNTPKESLLKHYNVLNISDLSLAQGNDAIRRLTTPRENN